MEMNLDFFDLLSWGSLVRVLGWFIGLFVLWRVNKDEINPSLLYGLISQLFFIGLVVYVISYIVNFPAGVTIAVLMVISVKTFGNRNKYDIWPILDSVVPVLLIYNLFDLSLTLAGGYQLLSLIKLLCLIVYLLVILPWSRKNFRILSWYPSGKPGFILMIFIGFWLVVELVFAYLEDPGLYWQSFALAICLIIDAIFLQNRSGRGWSFKGSGVINILKKRRDNVS